MSQRCWHLSLLITPVPAPGNTFRATQNLGQETNNAMHPIFRHEDQEIFIGDEMSTGEVLVELARPSALLRRTLAEVDAPAGWFEDAIATVAVFGHELVPKRFGGTRHVDAVARYDLVPAGVLSSRESTRLLWQPVDARRPSSVVQQATASAKHLSVAESELHNVPPNIDWPIALMQPASGPRANGNHMGLVPLAAVPTALPKNPQSFVATEAHINRSHPDLRAIVTDQTDLVFGEFTPPAPGARPMIDAVAIPNNHPHTALRDNFMRLQAEAAVK